MKYRSNVVISIDSFTKGHYFVKGYDRSITNEEIPKKCLIDFCLYFNLETQHMFDEPKHLPSTAYESYWLPVVKLNVCSLVPVGLASKLYVIKRKKELFS